MASARKKAPAQRYPYDDKGLIISVKEARKLLGVSYKDITDDDLATMILSMEKVSLGIIKNDSFHKLKWYNGDKWNTKHTDILE